MAEWTKAPVSGSQDLGLNSSLERFFSEKNSSHPFSQNTDVVNTVLKAQKTLFVLAQNQLVRHHS